jgi:hypothetical protein
LQRIEGNGQVAAKKDGDRTGEEHGYEQDRAAFGLV